MRKISSKLLLSIGLICFAYIGKVSAQENTSPFKRFSADISYGLPLYQGDFNQFFSQPLPFQGQDLGGITLYNLNSISGSVTLPVRWNLAARLRATQSSFYYSEALANVNFKNSAYDISLLLQYHFYLGKFNLYLLAGGGYHTSSDATIFETVIETENGTNEGQVQRVSTTAGLGVEFLVWRQFSLFLETDYTLTGSDRLDGYNGFSAFEIEQPDEKVYYSRDQLLTFRGGIRVYFTGNAKMIAESSPKKLPTTFYPNPYAADTTQTYDDGLTKELRDLGVKTALIGYTLEVNRVITIDELKRQKDTGERVVQALKVKYPNVILELLLETNGFTIHIGGLNSKLEAKRVRRNVLEYYSDAVIRRH